MARDWFRISNFPHSNFLFWYLQQRVLLQIFTVFPFHPDCVVGNHNRAKITLKVKYEIQSTKFEKQRNNTMGGRDL
jgi:hypothetical protein